MTYRTILNLLAVICIVSLAPIVAIAQTATATNARHETTDQRTISVLFDNTIQSAPAPPIAGWSVTIAGTPVTVNSVTVLGNRVSVQFDATALNGVPFILPTQTTSVVVAYDQATGSTLTNGSGNEINAFTLTSANNLVFTCSELDFFQQGNYAAVDVCSPVVMNFFQFQYKLSLRYRNSSNFVLTNFRNDITWGDATTTNAGTFYISDLTGAANATFVDYNSATPAVPPTIVLTRRPTHTYPAANPTDCSFNVSLLPYHLGIGTCPSIARTTLFPTYDTDNANSGALSLQPSVANSNRVCLGNQVDMYFSDNTLLNCRAAIEAAVPNEASRYIRIVYGSTNYGSGNIADIRVGGVPVTSNADEGPLLFPTGYYPTGIGGVGVPDFNGVIEIGSPVTVSTLLTYMQQITTVSSANHEVGERFYVRIDYWDVCNPYNAGSPDANRVSVENYIEIITKPNAPVATNKEYCFSETFASGGTCGAPTGEYFEVTAASIAGSVEVKWYNNATDAGLDQNAIDVTTTGYGANCRFMRPENRAGGTAAMTAAGVYSVYARYRTNSVAPNNCLSDPVQVTITRRSALSTPGAISPATSEVCDGTTNVAYSLASAAPVVAFGGTTEYSWTFSGGGGATVDAPTTAQNITADYSIGGAFASVTRSLDVVTRYTTNATTGGRCPTTASSRTVTIFGPTVGGTAAGGNNYCQGADAADITLSGHNGAVVRWEVNFNSGGFVDAGVGAVTSFDPGVLAPGNYVYRAVVANGPCSQQNSSTTTINVYQTPTTATAGVDQNLCQSLALPSGGLGGNTPVVGTGVWTQVSGPGTITFNPTTATPNATATASSQGIYVVRWTISTGAGLCSTFENVQLDFGATPATPDAGPAQDVCASSTNLNGTVPTTETGTWSVTAFPVGGTVSFSNVNSPTATVSLNGAMVYGTYTLRWRFTSGTCTPTEDFVDITFRQAPTATGPADFTACVDNPPTVTIPLSGTFGGGASNAHWEVTSGTGNLTSSGGNIGSNDASNPVDDVYTPTAADFTAGSIQVRLVTDDPTGACTSVNDPVTITIDRRPSAAVAGGNFNTCDATINLGATAVNNGGTGTWTVGTPLYYETFSTTNGLGMSGPNPHATLYTHPTSNWTITAPTANTLLANTEYMRIQSNLIETQRTRAELVWRSPSINVSGTVAISLQLAELGVMEAGDYINAFYRVNGAGAEIPIGSIVDDAAVDGALTTFSVGGITGATTIQVIIRVMSDAAGEFHRFDNIFVTNTAGTLPIIVDTHSPTTSVTSLPVGSTTFTWTATSALGTCSSSSSTVTVTRHPSPVNNNQTPQLCADVGTPGQATVTLAYLNTLVAGITGGATPRTVEFFTDAPGGTPFTVPITVTTGTVIHTRVTKTDLVPNCFTDGTITFTINARPVAIDPNPEYCEDLGTPNTRTNINLTLLDNAVKNNVAANTVAWFLSVGPDNPVPTPTNITANNGTTFIARVTNTNGCTTDIPIEITLNPIPAPNALLGATDVCLNGAVELYQLTTDNSGAGFTYSWNIPEPPFDRVIGGGNGDFLVLLSFPNTTAGTDISVTETSNKGCTGLPNVLNIKVNTSPPAITIAGPNTVCAGEAGVVYSVANLGGGTTYAWTVPTGASIIAGQGSNSITVNFGTADDGFVTVVPTTVSGGCPGNTDSYGVAVNDRPALTVAAPSPVCSDTNSGIILSGTLATTYNITNVSIPPGLSPASRAPITGGLADAIQFDQYTNTTGGNLTVQYTVVPVSASNCEGPAQIVNLTIRPEPVLAPNLNDNICSTTDAISVVLAVAAGSSTADEFQIASITNASGLTQVAGSQVVPGTYNSGILLDDKWTNTTGAVATIEYYVHPRNSVTGCLGDPAIPVIITVNPEPVVPAITDETICSGDTPTRTVTPSIPGSTFSWSVVGTTGLISGHGSGSGPSGSAITDVLINSGAGTATVTYSLTGTGPAGMGSCTGAAVTYTVTVNPSPTANNINRTVCSDAAGGNTVLIDLTTLQNDVHSGGGVTFTWSENLTMTPVINTATPYTITNGDPLFVEVDNGQCTKIATVTFIVNPLPSVTASALQFNGFEISCNGAANGQINATATPDTGTGPYIFSINAGTNYFPSGTFNGLAPGSYTIRVKDSKGCEVDSAPIQIDEPTPVVASSGTIVNVTCKGSATGSIQAVAAGGVGAGVPANYMYSLNGGAFQASPMFTGLSAGTYTITVRDANNCTDSEFVVVTEPTLLVATITSQTNVNCFGNSTGAVEVTGSGGVGPYQYKIGSGSYQAAPGIFTGLAAGNHVITVRDANNCETPITVTITQPAALTLVLNSKTDVLCNGGNTGSITVTGSGGTAPYQYDIGGGFQASGTFSGLTAGPYTVMVRDNQNCNTSINVTINEPTLLQGNITSQTNVACFGGTGSVTVNGLGGTGTYMYQLGAGTFQGSGTFTGLAAGNYVVTVRDQNLCTTPVNVTITQPTQLTGVVDNLTDALCNGTASGTVSILAGGGTSPYQYSINGGGLFLPSNTFTGLAAGNYTIIVRDNNLCTVNVPFTIGQPTSVAVVVDTKTNVDCKGNATGAVTVIGSGGTAPYLFSIGGAYQVSPTFTGLIAGSYIVTVRDNNLCESTVNLTITEPNFLVVSVSSIINVDCNGNSTGSVSVIGTGGTSPYQFSLVPVGNPAGAFANPSTFGGLAAGTYTIYIRDNNMCVSQVDATVTQPVTLGLNLISQVNVLCFGQATGTIAVQAQDGTGPYEYSINGGAFTSNNNFNFLTAQAYTITVRDFKGCQTSIPVTITQPTALTGFTTPIVKQNTYHLLCINDTDGELEVTASGGTGNPLTDFNYLLLEDAGKVPTIAADVTFTGLRAGSYRVRITDQNGCLFTTPAMSLIQPADISVAIQITSNYGVDQTDISCVGAGDGEVRVISVSGGARTGGGPGSVIADFSYTLSDGSNTTGDVNGIYTGLTNTLYTVTAEDANGCTKTSLPVVLIEPIPLFAGFIGSSHDICINQDNTDPFTVIASVFGGNGSYQYQWQESTSSTGPFTDILGATSVTYQASSAITQTMYYRRMVSTADAAASCPSLESNGVTITVNPLPTATIENQPAVCQGTPFLLDFNFLTGSAPFTFDYETLETGSPDPPTQVAGVIGASVRPIFINDYQEETNFRITRISDRNGCLAVLPIANYTVPIIKVDAAFNITSPLEQCSGSTFTFSYTVDTNVEYTFQWPDGLSTVLTPGTGTVSKDLVSFNPETSSDLPVVLTARHPSCAALTTSQIVTIFPAIMPNLVTNPTTMCSGTPISVVNLTQGGDDHDWTIVRVSDGATIQSLLDQTDADSQTFTIDNDEPTALNPDTYEIRYNISNSAANGGCTDQVIVPVRVYREVVAQIIPPGTPPGNIPFWTAGGVDLTFINDSEPVDGTDFQYDWTFVSGATPSSFNGTTDPLIHFSTAGTNKRARLVASNPAALADPLLQNNCQSIAEYTFTIPIAPLVAAFDYTPKAACIPSDIEITANTSTGDIHYWRVLNQNGIQIYESGEVTPTFPITTPGEYRVYLTTSSSLSAATPVTTGPVVIQIFANPVALFEALPSVLFVPDEELRTFNSSVSPTDPANSSVIYPIEYKWYFDDGTDSIFNVFEPRHFYKNEGNYDVSLVALNKHYDDALPPNLIAVCKDTAVQRVTAKAQGFTRVPNAFTPGTGGPTGGFETPGSPSRNDIFLPIMKGIKDFRMQIFDRWGNLVFQSVRTDQGWDGYDKNGNLLPAGVYVYKLELRLANDQRTTQVGDVTLIR